MGFNELTQAEHAFFRAGQGGNTDQSLKMWRKTAFKGEKRKENISINK